MAVCLQQGAESDAQCACQPIQVVETDIAFAALNSADVSPVQTTLFRQGFLAPALLLTKMPEVGRKYRPTNGSQWCLP